MEAPPAAGPVAFAAEVATPAAALAGDGNTAAGIDAGFAPSTPLAFAPAAADCDAAAPAGAVLDALADAAAGTAGSLTATPVASSAGTLSTAPSFKRLGLPCINADGFASKIDRAARPSTTLSCDPVAAAAISASDCPGFTVICVEVEAAGVAEVPAALCAAGAGAGAAAVADAAHAGDVQTSQAQAIASGTTRRVERVVMKVSRACKRASRWRLG